MYISNGEAGSTTKIPQEVHFCRSALVESRYLICNQDWHIFTTRQLLMCVNALNAFADKVYDHLRGSVAQETLTGWCYGQYVAMVISLYFTMGEKEPHPKRFIFCKRHTCVSSDLLLWTYLPLFVFHISSLTRRSTKNCHFFRGNFQMLCIGTG